MNTFFQGKENWLFQEICMVKKISQRILTEARVFAPLIYCVNSKTTQRIDARQ